MMRHYDELEKLCFIEDKCEGKVEIGIEDSHMDKSAWNILLAALSRIDLDKDFDPVHVQKVVYLLYRNTNIDDSCRPLEYIEDHHFGVYSKEVASMLESMTEIGFIVKKPVKGKEWFRYCLSDLGFSVGEGIFNGMNEKDKKVIIEKTNWVFNKNFDDLVASMYRDFPLTAANSKFRGKNH